MTNVVIVSAARTAVGSFSGSFANTPAHDMGSAVLEAIVDRAGIDKSEVSETILGQVLTGGQGQNPARQAHVNAGLPIEGAAWGINQVCGSGLRAVALGAQHIQLGDAAVVAAGGQENMSMSPHVQNLRAGHKMGDLKFIDSMIKDGLWDAFNGYHMGQTAENVAEDFNISRADQDAFALRSQHKAGLAQENGRLAREIMPVILPQRNGDPLVVDRDEHPRPSTTLADLQRLKTFVKADGTVTAGNASGVNDGAAALILASPTAIDRHGLRPIARVLGGATAGVAPRIMGFGPAPASKKLMERLGLVQQDFAVIELNEAFAAQGLATLRALGLADDDARVNPNGGAIALGHPLGMSGARITGSAMLDLKPGQKSLSTMCIGVGQGIAIALQAV